MLTKKGEGEGPKSAREGRSYPSFTEGSCCALFSIGFSPR